MGTSSSLINRRGVLLSGAAAVAVLSLPAGAVQPDLARTGGLFALGVEFARLRRRCARQGHRVRQLAAQAEELAASRGIGRVGAGRRHSAALDAIRTEVGYHAAWARWSSTSNEVAQLADRIARYPARNRDDVATKFEALQWSLLDDGVLLDDAVRRQVQAFGRELRELSWTPG